MGLYHLTNDRHLRPIPATSFAAEQVLERADLQAALRDHIQAIDPNLLVVAEEFGDFEDVRRRIDLLCVDRSGQLVVVELKRTDDGGHMELQALRYAAMVSTMTFDQLSDVYERHLAAVAPQEADQARAKLAEFLQDAEGEETVLDRRVRIVLASAGFDTQITTTVLWLNDLYGLDIMCIRLTPYRVDERLLLDVQQVIPLPEAQELMVRLRHRESTVRSAATGAAGADWTPYVIRTPSGETPPLRKRRAILALVQALHAAGVSPDVIARQLPPAKFLSVPGILEGDELGSALAIVHSRSADQVRRFFVETPVYDEVSERTWVLSKMWGLNTEAALRALVSVAPSPGYSFQAVEG